MTTYDYKNTHLGHKQKPALITLINKQTISVHKIPIFANHL